MSAVYILVLQSFTNQEAPFASDPVFPLLRRAPSTGSPPGLLGEAGKRVLDISDEVKLAEPYVWTSDSQAGPADLEKLAQYWSDAHPGVQPTLGVDDLHIVHLRQHEIFDLEPGTPFITPYSYGRLHKSIPDPEKPGTYKNTASARKMIDNAMRQGMQIAFESQLGVNAPPDLRIGSVYIWFGRGPDKRILGVLKVGSTDDITERIPQNIDKERKIQEALANEGVSQTPPAKPVA